MPIENQTASCVLMIAPRHFAVNAETSASNAFQARRAPANLAGLARRECLEAAASLERAGLRILLAEDTDQPVKPDAVFPNNWISTHADGRVILYPLHAVNRRPERRMDIVESLRTEHGFSITAIDDLSGLEEQGQFLEGTGSLVLDRVNRVAYAGWSSRTQPAALDAFLRVSGYSACSFRTRGDDGRPVYHSNVMLSIGREFVVLCEDVVEPADLGPLRAALLESGRRLITISASQMHAFAGNLLELDTTDGAVIALSATALTALDTNRRRQLEQFGCLLPLDLAHIEAGGGSIRCMLAEIFLPLAGIESPV